MAVAIIQPSFSAGELSPNLYGRVDLAKFHIGASTMRNFFVNYRGGSSSRAGTRFVGWSAQSRTGVPPRVIRFQFSLSQGILLEFGEEYVRFILNGDYVTETAKIITGITQASPGVITSVAHGLQNGDLVFLFNIAGMIELNGNTYTVANATLDTFQLVDMFGNVVNTTTFDAYTSGGTAARIYTVTTPYAATDLPSLKFTQSADVMTFVHPSFPSYDLTRIDDNHWTFIATSFNPLVPPPTTVTATATSTVDGNVNFVNITAVGAGYNALPEVKMVTSTGHGAVLAATIAGGAVVGITVVSAGSAYDVSDTVSITGGGGAGAVATADIGTSPVPPTTYSYIVTALDKAGNESIASAIASVTNSVDISAIQGTIEIKWHRPAGGLIYHIYKAPPSFNASTPTGTIFGFIGFTRGNKFIDNNILPDFVTTPPLFQNPFAPGQITAITGITLGSGYTSEPTAVITTATGSGAVLEPVIVDGHMESVIIVNAGHDYLPGDTVTITGGGGSGALAHLVIGPNTGTYPSVVAYFQERRVYANTFNQPDTYFMSQPGLFTNFDVPVIPLDDSAIIGTPWAQQVNGIEQMVPVPTGLIVLTGLSAWLVNGGGQGAAITPTSQSATAQAYNGCHNNIPPIQINYDILYVQSKGSIVRDLSYNLWVNIYTGTDISVISDHLFLEHQIQEWAWAEEPHKVVWAVRDDGIMLSLSYLKEQEVQGWARHDTKGLFQSVATVTEQVTTTAVDTLSDIVYVAVLRFVNGQQMYYIERMDPRFWDSVESSWCLDCALALPQPTPDAILTASQSYFPGKINSTVTIVDGGSGYTMPSATIVDPQSKGKGQGAKVAVSQTAGIITSIVVIDQGRNYVAPQITIVDPTGLGCVAALSLDNRISFTSSAFAGWAVGDVIRMGGGQATITAVASGTQCTANLTEEITTIVPNDPLNRPVPAPSGQWTVTTPVTTLSGLNHLEGQEVSVLADGSVVSVLTVIDGTIELAAPASSIIVGLPFQAQLQSLNTDVPGEATVQGKRKNIYAVTVRVENSRGLKVGANQPNAAAVGFNEPWENLVEIKERGNSIWAGSPIPLFTGDERVTIPASWRKGGQVAVQQDYPLPANILAFIPEEVIGDSNG